MKRNHLYVLKSIANIPYLLPIGQMIADQRRGVQLNETGVFLWNLLETPKTTDELVKLCALHYEMDQEDIPLLEKDITDFLSTLNARGILLPDSEDLHPRTSFYHCMKIAGLTCGLYGNPEAFSHNFDAFFCEFTASVQQTIEVLTDVIPLHENGTLLLRNDELSIMECNDKYIILFPASNHIREVHLQKDASFARFYCTPPFTDDFREELFHAIRLTFLYLAQKNHMIVLHSASILYREKAWLFSASSGTGKSTHANLWAELLQAPVLNGDLNLLAMEGQTPVIHGLPWCGTSGICNTATYPLGGIILLRRSDTDYVSCLSDDEKLLLITQRLISPCWTGAQLEHNLQLVEQITKHIFTCRLFCTPNPSAMEVLKKEIDSLYF